MRHDEFLQLQADELLVRDAEIGTVIGIGHVTGSVTVKWGNATPKFETHATLQRAERARTRKELLNALRPAMESADGPARLAKLYERLRHGSVGMGFSVPEVAALIAAEYFPMKFPGGHVCELADADLGTEIEVLSGIPDFVGRRYTVVCVSGFIKSPPGCILHAVPIFSCENAGR